MPTWTTTIPDDPRGQGLPLLRTPAARSIKAIVTSHGLIGTDTHFWGGHTVPCEAPTCEACEAGIAYRWHAYLSAFNPDDQLHFIFECTANAAQAFADYHDEHKSLRACLFEAYRWKHARNGRVIVKCTPSGIHSAALPQPPDLYRVMSIIWRLPIKGIIPGPIERRIERIYADRDGDGQSPDPKTYDTPQP